MREMTSRSIYTACGLGFAAFLFNAPFAGSALAPGLIPLVCAAALFGFPGAVYASVCAALPSMLFQVPAHEIARLVAITACIGFWQGRAARVPSILVGVSTFVACWAASELVRLATGTAALGAWRVEMLVNDTFAIALAVAALSYDYLWYAAGGRPRILIVPHRVANFVTAGGLGLIALCVYGLGPTQISALVGGPIAFTIATLAAALLPTLVVSYLPWLLPRGQHGAADRIGSISGDRNLGFSGVSSMFWRRRELAESENRSSSESRIDIQGASAIGFGPEYGVCVIDGMGTISLANRKFSKLVHTVERQPIGKQLSNLSMSAEIFKTFLDLITVPSGMKRTREVRFADVRSGSDRFFELSVIPSHLAPGSLQGDPSAKVLTIKEVTDSRAIEKTLLHSQKLASLGSVVAGIGHAFNSALTTIIGRASHARLLTEPAAVRDGLNEIILEAQRAGVFVNKLLDFAHETPAAKTSFDARKFVESRQELFKNIVGTAHHFEAVIPERTLGISCDQSLLTQALTNLLINAKEALPSAGGRITLSLGVETIDPDAALLNVSAYPGTFVRLRVSDTGHGMSAAVLKHACEPTFTTRTNSGHAGLGLPTVFAIARAHDGFLTIESAPERGSTISLYLPEVQLQPDATLAAQAAVAQGADRSKCPRVLVVEDEPTIRELVSGMLEALGAKVVACERPQEALDLAKNDQFDVAFVDLVMPTMGGNEWVSNLRAQDGQSKSPKLPVVLMTGHGAGGEHNDSIHSVLPKPFTMDDLKASLRSVSEAKNE
jgi:signal transduction histidine kinase/ActR/RegA family two-component response regulator